jgi:hypothetical protein
MKHFTGANRNMRKHPSYKGEYLSSFPISSVNTAKLRNCETAKLRPWQ